MPYDFDEVIDRSNTRSIKWHYDDDTIAMWVADMDFRAAMPILESMQQVLAHGILGYSKPTDALYAAIINWHKSRYGLALNQHEIVFSPGVVPSLALMINVLTEVGDAVLINDPIYTPFVGKTKITGRRAISSALLEKEGRYYLDLADIEAKIVKDNVKLYLLCNPHNPGGRVWSADELTALLELCKKYDVAVVSDEIHQDLTLSGHQFTPFLSLAEGYEHKVVSLTSMTKTFNLAGIKGSMIFAKDAQLLAKIRQQQQLNDECQLNTFAYTAMQSAYEHGDEWLDQALAYIEQNIEFTIDFLATHLPDIKVMRPEASFLLWLDCSAYVDKGDDADANSDVDADKQLYDRLRAAKVELNAGRQYGEQGHLKMRINVACPRSVLAEGLERVCQGLLSKV